MRSFAFATGAERQRVPVGLRAGAGALVEPLHPRGHVRGEPDPVGSVRAVQHPDLLIRPGRLRFMLRPRGIIASEPLHADLRRDDPARVLLLGLAVIVANSQHAMAIRPMGNILDTGSTFKAGAARRLVAQPGAAESRNAPDKSPGSDADVNRALHV